MDYPSVDMFDDDIDARLARYDEEKEPEVGEFKNFSQDQLKKKIDRTKESFIIDKNKEISENSPQKPIYLHDDNRYSLRIGFERRNKQTKGYSNSSSAIMKSGVLEIDTASELNIRSKNYSNGQQVRVINHKDQYGNYSCSKKNTNVLPKTYSASQENRILREDNLFDNPSCSKVTSGIYHTNSSHISLTPSAKKEFNASNEYHNKKKSHYTFDCEDLEDDKIISSKSITDLEKSYETYKFVSSPTNGARMKNITQDSYVQIGSDAYFPGNRNDERLHRNRANKYLSEYSRYGDFKKNQNKKLNLPRTNNEQNLQYEKERANRMLMENDYCDELHISNSKNSNYDQKRESSLKEKHLQDDIFKQSGKINSNYHATFDINNVSISANNFKTNHMHQNNMQSNFEYNIQEASFNDKCMAFESRGPQYETQVKHRYFNNVEENDDIWKRQSACDKEISDTPLNSNLRKNRSRKSTVNTFTMHDARRIAPMILNCSFDESPVTENVSQIIEEEEMFKYKRKCWTRFCWSHTKHSHALNISKDLHSWKDRNAIINSMKSPQYSTKSKKKSFTDCWSTFLKSSVSRFELWNRTLKKIEGQFGTGVVSYFVFLRWLILLNFVIFILHFLLIILPYSAFALLPHQYIKSAPNTTLLTDEYLQQFPKYENVPFTRKRIGTENVSLNLNLDGDLLSNLGTLLDNYVPDEILDITLRYDKRNFTGKQRHDISVYCEDQYEKIMANHTKGTLNFLQDFLQGTGWLQSTILFLGYYPDKDVSYFGLSYNLPVSILAAFFVSLFLSLVLMVQYSSHGIQENVLTKKSNYLTFSNILFCSWDYCIEDKKTADIRHKSITCEIKSNLAEEHRKLEVSHWSSEKWMKVYALRATINIIVIGALFGSFYLIYKVVNLQLLKQRQNALGDAGMYTLFIQFLPPLVITILNIIMPIIFYNLVKFEMYTTRTEINIALFRIVFLRLASVFVLVSSLYQQITCLPKDICGAGLNELCQSPNCWETYVGQQFYKLAITDFFVYVCMFLAYDLPRDFLVQKCRCKVTEVVGRQVFDIPSQVLSLVYSQTLCWLGLLYSPLLPGITLLKFLIIFYIKKNVVLKHCVPAPVLYKASRSNSIFMTILMISFFVGTMIHGYSLTSIEPSPGCSPFRQHIVMIHAISDAITNFSPKLVKFMTYIFSGFFFIPASFLISIVIYYYWTVVAAHKQMTKVLKAQIAVEGRDKQFLLNRLAEAARQATTN